jgi:hypothetical protein
VKDVLAYIDKGIERLGGHRLFDWLESDATPLAERLMFLPSVTHLAMGFRDVNKWVLRYPAAVDDMERGINVHTFEDQTHSRLFLEDWRLLGLDRKVDWTAGDTLWWQFLAQPNSAAREHGIYFQAMGIADGGDPLLRYAHGEVGERCARDLFFARVSGIAARLSAETGVELRYLGPHHIDAEGEGAEGVFETQVLDERQRERAIELVDAMFVVFEKAFDAILGYARALAGSGRHPRPGTKEFSAPLGMPGREELLVHPTQESVRRLLSERGERTARHPFFTWLSNRDGRHSALETLRSFYAMWAMDAVGYHDVHHFVVRYPDASSELEHAVNDQVAELTARARLHLADWRRLGLDEVLPWSPGETLEYYYLDPLMDGLRRHRVRTVKLAARHSDPLVRLWLMLAFRDAADLCADGTREMAAEAEAAEGLRLDCLAGRAARHPLRVDLAAHAMTADQREAAMESIESVFAAVDARLESCLEAALSDRFPVR